VAQRTDSTDCSRKAQPLSRRIDKALQLFALALMALAQCYREN
jgi:hypothetical protein